MLKILLVDDHTIFRIGVRQIIQAAFEDVAVGEAATGRDALEQARRETFDVVVLDITMPDLNGLETLRRLKHEHPQLPVVMLSTHANPYYVKGSFKAGAAGYVSKDRAPEDLVQALEAVLSGGTYVRLPAEEMSARR